MFACFQPTGSLPRDIEKLNRSHRLDNGLESSNRIRLLIQSEPVAFPVFRD